MITVRWVDNVGHLLDHCHRLEVVCDCKCFCRRVATHLSRRGESRRMGSACQFKCSSKVEPRPRWRLRRLQISEGTHPTSSSVECTCAVQRLSICQFVQIMLIRTTSQSAPVSHVSDSPCSSDRSVIVSSAALTVTEISDKVMPCL
jgi:hypothetical protein